jgi:hypothetical protein
MSQVTGDVCDAIDRPAAVYAYDNTVVKLTILPIDPMAI